MPGLKIVVVGGGLAGIATALAIHQAGHEAEILERTTAFQPVGGGIQLAPNATSVLSALGVLDQIMPFATIPSSLLIRTYKTGQLLLEVPFGSCIEEAYQYPYLAVHRANLHRILLDEVQARGVRVRLGCDIKSFQTSADQAEVHLQDGTIVTATLIVGADGERSACRDFVLGHEDPLHGSGDIIYRLAVDLDSLDPNDEATATVKRIAESYNINYWMGPEAHAVSYMLSSDRILNVILTKVQPPSDTTTYRMQPCEREELEALFQGWDERLQDILRVAQQLSKWTLLQASENTRWSDQHRRLVLLGDAAHAMLPHLAQGAAQGFEDAAVLGQLLSRTKRAEDVPSSVEKFEFVRKDRAITVRQRSQDMRSVFALEDGPEQANRDERISKGQELGCPIMTADPAFQTWLWGYKVSIYGAEVAA